MKVTVTGGAGFLGRYVVDALVDQGDEVFVARSDEFDLRDKKDGCMGLVYTSKPEAIIHLAARVGGIGDNVSHPGLFLYENALMGLQLMEEARKAGVQKFLTVGTACMYPADAEIPIREEDLWDGPPAHDTAPYGYAKRLICEQGQAYREEYDFDAIMVIPSNLYGPGDRSSHVVPEIVRKFESATEDGSDEVMLWGSGKATRDFLYVVDAAEGIVQALNYYDEPTPVNLGSGEEVPIWKLARMVKDAYGFNGTIRWDPMAPEGTQRRCLDITRAAQKMSWSPQTPLDEGLKRTIAA